MGRLEDRRFLTGEGRYADDMTLADMARAYVLRSPHGHARIIGIDKTDALAIAERVWRAINAATNG